MLIAHYIGDHTKDDISARIGWTLTRAVQRGPYKNVTHSEAIHTVHEDGEVTLASSSLREGGVRSKKVKLNPNNWLISNVPQWYVQDSISLLDRTRGKPYDWRGALATVLPFKESKNAWFCNEWVAAPYLQAPHIFGPAQFCTICMSIGQDVTKEFFYAQIYNPNVISSHR